MTRELELLSFGLECSDGATEDFSVAPSEKGERIITRHSFHAQR
jgi:hypothetical protein